VGKKRVGFVHKTGWVAIFYVHNRFGWQAKTATTNGVICLKNPQFRIVKTGGFSYVLGIRCRPKFYPDLHHNYVEYF
jgi:hypothetical protein